MSLHEDNGHLPDRVIESAPVWDPIATCLGHNKGPGAYCVTADFDDDDLITNGPTMALENSGRRIHLPQRLIGGKKVSSAPKLSMLTTVSPRSLARISRVRWFRTSSLSLTGYETCTGSPTVGSAIRMQPFITWNLAVPFTLSLVRST